MMYNCCRYFKTPNKSRGIPSLYKKKIKPNLESDKPGFTLVEVLITMFLLTSVLTAIAGMLATSANFLLKTKQVTLASQAIQQQVETIRNLPFDNILTLENTFNNGQLSQLEGGHGFQYIEGAFGADIKKLTVKVKWVFRGRQMEQDVVTFVTRGGINGR